MSLAGSYSLCRVTIVGWKDLSNVLGTPVISRSVKKKKSQNFRERRDLCKLFLNPLVLQVKKPRLRVE